MTTIKKTKMEVMMTTYTNSELEEFVLNQNKNPKTGRNIKIGSKLHGGLLKESKNRNISKKELYDRSVFDVINECTESPPEITKLVMEFCGNNDIFYIIDQRSYHIHITMCSSLSTVSKITEKFYELYKSRISHYVGPSKMAKMTVLQAPITFQVNISQEFDKNYIIQEICVGGSKINIKDYKKPNISNINTSHTKSYVRGEGNCLNYFQNETEVITDIQDCLKNSHNFFNYKIYEKIIKNSHSDNYIYSSRHGRCLVDLQMSCIGMSIRVKDEFKSYEKELKELLFKKYITLIS